MKEKKLDVEEIYLTSQSKYFENKDNSDFSYLTSIDESAILTARDFLKSSIGKTYTNDTNTIKAVFDGEEIIVKTAEKSYIFSVDTTLLNASNAEMRSLNVYNLCNTNSSSAFGYSGKIYSYTLLSNQATLEIGILSKTNTYDTYAARFYSEVWNMAAIHSSLNSIQLTAWTILRVVDLFGFSTEAGVTDVAGLILSMAGVDLGGQLQATVFGFYDWYQAEKRAKEYYDLF